MSDDEKPFVENEDALENQFEVIGAQDEIDKKFGFSRVEDGPEQLGWLINMHSTVLKSDDWQGGHSAVDLYFLEEDGHRFKVSLPYSPYFLLNVRNRKEAEVEKALKVKFEQKILRIELVEKEDLDLPNHLVGLRSKYLQLFFHNTLDLMVVRQFLQPFVRRNKNRRQATEAYEQFDEDLLKNPQVDNFDFRHRHTHMESVQRRSSSIHQDWTEHVMDIREYDIPYYLRTAIDLDIRVGYWYDVRASPTKVTVKRREDKLSRPDPVILAFDIETSKQPLKFPDMKVDPIMMISYMVDGQGFLITNRDIVSEDIDDFEYSPKPEFEGVFKIFNENDEAAMLRRFMDHIVDVKPAIFVTYNGDTFDWPYVEARCTLHGIDMGQEIGFRKDAAGEYKSRYGLHMDAFRWVKRDSYLPAGSHGLKAVTREKLGYVPAELDPEDMTRFAQQKPKVLAAYSVSDSVATYYLYMKYVHPFIFSLCNVIPLQPDEVLRKGSGTLCETLLMAESFQAHIVMPNKQVSEMGKSCDGHLLESETYVGAHVEALEAGVFRHDLPVQFRLRTAGIERVLLHLRDALTLHLASEGVHDLHTVTNFETVYEKIRTQLEELRDQPSRLEPPLIYHLDVGAMYPNIILTNRLQPSAIVSEATCAACDFNTPDKQCQRMMTWSWRGELYPAQRSETDMIRHQLEAERFPGRRPTDPTRAFHQLPFVDQNHMLAKRLSEYSRKVYKRTHVTKIEERTSIVCQRENAFYVNTVQAFRDRRNDYKARLKHWKKLEGEALTVGDRERADEAGKMTTIYESLQLAHKCILNSFYGYVMRKGARWYSMEMAGIVCQTGVAIITMARELVEQLGRPLELDTDGIWCVLPSSFPEDYVLTLQNNKKITLSYPCVMLNYEVHHQFTNHQYHTPNPQAPLQDTVQSVNTIAFEVDGPYRAMVLPAAKEEGKLLKKRYAVFNRDGSLKELKGFEIKRRGELKLIKIFQEQIFGTFLEGNTLEDAYGAAASVANQWLDVLFTRGGHLTDVELLDLISENRSMSRTLEDYGAQKSTSISTARRLAEFLGDKMTQDRGLNCKFVISAKPYGTPVTERAVPVAIFSADVGVRRYFLRKWLRDSGLTDLNIRALLDWDYYIERLGSVIQKLISIPAAMQKISNPVPRIKLPDWLAKRVAEKDSAFKQTRLSDLFGRKEKEEEEEEEEEPTMTRSIQDMEDMAAASPARAQWMKRTQASSDNTITQSLPDPSVDYLAWLAAVKPRWQALRARLRKRRTLYDSGPSVTEESVDQSATASERRMKERLIESPWQIVQMSETEVPGEFSLWIIATESTHSTHLSTSPPLPSPAVHQVIVRVPRTLLVNSRVADETGQWPRVNRWLPRSHPAHYLYEVTLSEVAYRQRSRDMTAFLSHPDIEGVYESHVPLDFKALVQLGCCVSVKPRRGLLSSPQMLFELDDLVFRSVSQQPYLERLSVLPLAFLFHASLDKQHQLLAVVSSRSTHRMDVLLVEPARSTHSLSASSLQRLYREIVSSLENTHVQGYFQFPATLEVAWQSVSSERQAFRSLGRLISGLSSDTVFFVQSPLTESTRSTMNPTAAAASSAEERSSMLLRELPSLSRHAVIRVPQASSAAATSDALSALDWHRQSARRLLKQYTALNAWIDAQLGMARYAHCPLGNLDTQDFPIFAADVFFARHLRANDCVWWTSSEGRPDLGGREQDDHASVLLSLPLQQQTSPSSSVTSTLMVTGAAGEAGQGAEVNVGGAYKTVCVELELAHLAINVMLESQHINDIEGARDSYSFDDALQASMDDHFARASDARALVLDGPSACIPAFRILKSLVSSWSHEAAVGKNALADTLLMHFYRWVRGASRFHADPALFTLVHGMMRKVLMQLLAEWRRLGARVVYASFHRLVLATSKVSLPHAEAYLQYGLKTLRAKPLFSWMACQPVAWWDYLLWMDAANYGGIRCVDAAAATAAEKQSVEMHWHMAKFLPRVLQTPFQLLVAEYIYELHRQLVRVKTQEAHHPQLQQRLSVMHMDPEEEEEEEKEKQDASSLSKENRVPTRKAFAARVMTEQLGGKLFKIVPDILHTLGDHEHDFEVDAVALALMGAADTERAVPQPALALIKAVMTIFAMDPWVRTEVRQLRRDLLALVRVSEYSDEATFRPPVQGVRLMDVICAYCNVCRDMDFCRDADLLERPWKCVVCGHAYDARVMEGALIDDVSRLLVAYQLQDLQCVKCRAIKATQMATVCSCSGQYQLAQLSRAQLMHRLRVFAGMAEVHDLRLLKDTVQWATTVAGG